MALPHRTDVTQLSDDELLLFDFLFKWRLEEQQLRREVYPFHMNVRYNHNLSDERLHETLLRLASQGLVIANHDAERTQWSLTPQGGAQWELERQPRWDAYCTASEKTLQSDRPLLAVLSLERAIGEKCWSAGVKTRLWTMRDESPRYWRIANHRLIPWRSLPAFHVLVARGAAFSADKPDWKAYEAERTWWDTITEIDGLEKKRG